ncbi:unnamed protein product [Clavelina lepadiformis]|uniref:inositol-phosphate phosphatase n=1 Tax=Clavelina lepadiformis TaxID=159417 RepID=A0ABP0GHS4_CLALP
MSPSGVRLSPVGVSLIFILSLSFVFYFGSMYYARDMVSMQALLVAGIDFAERGGVKVKYVHDQGKLDEKSKGETLEGANVPLTDGDLFSNQAMMQSFRKSFPNVKVVSEEKEAVNLVEDVAPAPEFNAEVHKLVTDPLVEVPVDDITIWIDPLDATQEYTESLLQFVTTMVCVAVKGKPTIGIVHKPFEKKTYWSWVGHGSNIDDNSQSDSKSIIVSRSHQGEVESIAHDAFGDDASVIPAGGAGYKSLALFEGTASVYVHTTQIKKWDICAGNAILRHAQGRMTTLHGEEIDYSASGSPVNNDGLVAAIHNHDVYLEKLGKILR